VVLTGSRLPERNSVAARMPAAQPREVLRELVDVEEKADALRSVAGVEDPLCPHPACFDCRPQAVSVHLEPFRRLREGERVAHSGDLTAAPGCQRSLAAR
jgi:hypothetical protein